MNILQTEDIIKGLPDQRLMQEAQQPSGQVPQFLVISEIQRRTDMRKRFQAQQQQPEGTVADQIVQEAGGITRLPVQQPNRPPQQQQVPPQRQMMPPQMPVQPQMAQQGPPQPPMQQMRSGGIVRLAGGTLDTFTAEIGGQQVVVPMINPATGERYNSQAEAIAALQNGAINLPDVSASSMGPGSTEQKDIGLTPEWQQSLNASVQNAEPADRLAWLRGPGEIKSGYDLYNRIFPGNVSNPELTEKAINLAKHPASILNLWSGPGREFFDAAAGNATIGDYQKAGTEVNRLGGKAIIEFGKGLASELGFQTTPGPFVRDPKLPRDRLRETWPELFENQPDQTTNRPDTDGGGIPTVATNGADGENPLAAIAAAAEEDEQVAAKTSPADPESAEQLAKANGRALQGTAETSNEGIRALLQGFVGQKTETPEYEDLVEQQKKDAYAAMLVQLGAGIASGNMPEAISKAGEAALAGKKSARELEMQGRLLKSKNKEADMMRDIGLYKVLEDFNIKDKELVAQVAAYEAQSLRARVDEMKERGVSARATVNWAEAAVKASLDKVIVLADEKGNQIPPEEILNMYVRWMRDLLKGNPDALAMIGQTVGQPGQKPGTPSKENRKPLDSF